MENCDEVPFLPQECADSIVAVFTAKINEPTEMVRWFKSTLIQSGREMQRFRRLALSQIDDFSTFFEDVMQEEIKQIESKFHSLNTQRRLLINSPLWLGDDRTRSFWTPNRHGNNGSMNESNFMLMIPIDRGKRAA